MNEPVIGIRNVGKQYILGRRQKASRTFREMLEDTFWAPIARVGQLGNERAVPEQFWALQDINLDINRGDIVGIIGHNGAGKSTLLKILSRITEPTTGRIEIVGRLASLLEVGTGFHSELTGRENIFLNGAILGMSRKEIARKFDEIVTFAEVEQFLDTPVKHYSSGMYVRLAFAVAAHLEPEILILDEVLAVGDAAFQKKCITKMEDISGDGRTIVFVSHNLALVRSLCTRAIVLDHGRIVQDNDVESAINFYLNSDIGSGGSITWLDDDAPRCPQAVLRKAYVLNQYGVPASLLDCRFDFSIVLEYEILKPMKQFRVGALLQNGAGVCVGGSTDWGAWQEDIRGPGVFRSVCRFPGNVLNHGIYSVCFAIDSTPHVERHLTTDYCLSFEIEDMEGHGPLASRLPGIVRPPIKWSVTKEDETKMVGSAV